MSRLRRLGGQRRRSLWCWWVAGQLTSFKKRSQTSPYDCLQALVVWQGESGIVLLLHTETGPIGLNSLRDSMRAWWVNE